MPQNSTLIPGSEQDEERNIGQRHADQTFSGLSNAERAGTVNMDDFENSFKNDTADVPDSAEARKREHEAAGAPQPSWTDNTGQSGGKGEKKGRWKGWFKKASPALGIGGIFGIGGFVLIGLTSPSLLIVQMKEVMMGKFNTQLATMETRSSKLLASKMQGATSGHCGSVVTIRCKFTTMSQKQVDRLKAAGIEVEGTDAITGRKKPTGLVFKGERIAPADFSRMANTDAEFRSALRQAYNPKYAGFVGKAWASVATKFKTNKQPPDLNAAEDPEEARQKMNQIAQEGAEDVGSRTRLEVDPDCEGSSCLSDEDADRINSAVDESSKDGSAAAEVRSKLSGINAGAVGSFFKITGPIDSGCQVYGALTTLSYAAKAIRTAQLVRYAMIFLSVADGIKAGISPAPEDIELLGNVATQTVKSSDDASKTLVGSATDSYGYKYAAYGDSSASAQSMQIANRFMAGGGFVGELSAATATALSFIPGGRDSAKTTCSVLANPFVQGGSILLGVASLFVPGANVGKIAASAAASVAVGVVLAVLPTMLADIVAGTVTDDIIGEESGNAITSGAGSLMSDSLAAQNGNGPMTKEDTLAYLNLQNETSNQYIADELRETSPFDASNPNTFIGSITAKLLPLRSSSNPLTTLGSLLNNSLGSIIPSSKAVTTEEQAAALNVCNDQDVLDAGYAADPFCNVIRGIPPKYLDKDPVAVAADLIGRGVLSDDGTPKGEYAEFITKCITNEEPLGYQNMDTGYDNAAAQSCIINDSNANYYLNYADQRIELGMNGEDIAESGGSSTSSVAGATIDMDAIFEDSTSVACAPGTTDAGNTRGFYQKKEIPIKLCSIPNTTHGSQPARVNSRVSGAVLAMTTQMRTDLGLDSIKFADSFRTMESQEHAWRCNGGNGGRLPGEDCSDIAGRAAEPGTSNHQLGIALDFQLPSGNSGATRPGDSWWRWLNENAAKYGFSSNVGESWHWSATGQ